MDGIQYYKSGIVAQEWNDELRQYTYRNTDGAILEQRPYTAEENAQADARAAYESAVVNEAALMSKARQALISNAEFLANTSVTNAQAVSQVKALTRQVNALIRLQVRDLSNISDS